MGCPGFFCLAGYWATEAPELSQDTMLLVPWYFSRINALPFTVAAAAMSQYLEETTNTDQSNSDAAIVLATHGTLLPD